MLNMSKAFFYSIAFTNLLCINTGKKTNTYMVARSWKIVCGRQYQTRVGRKRFQLLNFPRICWEFGLCCTRKSALIFPKTRVICSTKRPVPLLSHLKISPPEKLHLANPLWILGKRWSLTTWPGWRNPSVKNKFINSGATQLVERKLRVQEFAGLIPAGG